MSDTPEVRRDEAVAAIIAAGGVILATTPLATPDDPHTVAAYRVTAGSPDPAVAAAVALVRADTLIPGDFIPWTPILPEVPDAVPAE